MNEEIAVKVWEWLLIGSLAVFAIGWLAGKIIAWAWREMVMSLPEWTNKEYKEAEMAFAKKRLREAKEAGDEGKIRCWQGIVDELGGRGWFRKFLERRKG